MTLQAIQHNNGPRKFCRCIIPLCPLLGHWRKYLSWLLALSLLRCHVTFEICRQRCLGDLQLKYLVPLVLLSLELLPRLVVAKSRCTFLWVSLAFAFVFCTVLLQVTQTHQRRPETTLLCQPLSADVTAGAAALSELDLAILKGSCSSLEFRAQESLAMNRLITAPQSLLLRCRKSPSVVWLFTDAFVAANCSLR